MPVKLYYVADLEFALDEDPITTGDGKSLVECPFDGEILGARNGPLATGHIEDVGTGTGTYTEIQIRNTDTGRDYFTTKPRFNVDDGDVNGRAVLSGGVLRVEPTFKQGNLLALDVDSLPSGNDSARATVWLTCGFWRQVD